MLNDNIIGVRGPDTEAILEVFRQQSVKILAVSGIHWAWAYSDDIDYYPGRDDYEEDPVGETESRLHYEARIHYSPSIGGDAVLVVPMEPDGLVTFGNIVESVDDIEAAWIRFQDHWTAGRTDFPKSVTWLSERGFARGESVWDRMKWTREDVIIRFHGDHWRVSLDHRWQEGDHLFAAISKMVKRLGHVDECSLLVPFLLTDSEASYLQAFTQRRGDGLNFYRTIGTFSLRLTLEGLGSWNATLSHPNGIIDPYSHAHDTSPEAAALACIEKAQELGRRLAALEFP